MSEYKTLTHEFSPVYDENSRILILGSFPSAKSREVQFYCGHPQNRFWKVLTAVFAASYKLFNKYQEKSTGKSAVRLPSTSPANAQWSPERLIEEWKIIRDVQHSSS